MSDKTRMHLTRAGADLLNRTHHGATITFTRLGLGAGHFDTVEQMRAATALKDERMSVPITKATDNKDATSTLEAYVKNESLERGFSIGEVGVYAQDPQHGEILYMVCDNGEEADFLPAKTTHPVEMLQRIVVIVGDAAEVTVTAPPSMVYVTYEEFLRLAGKNWSEENVKKNAEDILKLQVELASLKGATANGMNQNIFAVTFSDFLESEEYEGVWDEERRRLGLYPGRG